MKKHLWLIAILLWVSLGLIVVNIASGEVLTLKWTAVADDDNIVESGPADHYELKYATYTITAVNFDSVADIITTETPKAPGEQEVIVVDLPLGFHYWFAIKVYDEVGNVSLISNILDLDFFPPAAVVLELE